MGESVGGVSEGVMVMEVNTPDTEAGLSVLVGMGLISSRLATRNEFTAS